MRSGAAITGSAGKITNCQIGVFAAYVSRHGHAFIDRALYLPKEWTDDPDHLEAAYVPPGVGFVTKPKLAMSMIARRHSRVCTIQVGCGDTVYGVGDILNSNYAGQAKATCSGSAALMYFNPGAKEIGRRQGRGPSLGRGARPIGNACRQGPGPGPRLHDWCYLELADLEVEEFNSANQGLWTRGLLIRRHIADGDLAFFTTWCPAGTSIETLVAVEGHRWAIEDSFETAKNEFGLDHNESRSWHGWHRHVSLAMLAFAMMAVIRHRANPPPSKKRNAGSRQRPRHNRAAADSLVNPGSPPHRHQTCSKADSIRACHRMVILAQGSPSRRSTRSPQSTKATVMLEPVLN